MSTIAIPSNTPAEPYATLITAAHRWLLGVVVAGALLGYGYTLARYGQAAAVADAHLYYAHAHSWYFDNDCDYENNLRSNPELEARRFYLRQRSPTGRVINIFPCGWSVIALPFVALADGLTALHNVFAEADIPRDGHTVYYRAVVPLGHVLLGIAGLLAAYAVAARYVPKTIAAVATALVWMGTNVGYFISVEPTMTHAASLGFVSLMIWTADNIHRAGWSFGRAIGLGLCAGLMTAVRHQNFAWLLLPLILLGIPLANALYRREPVGGRQLALSLVAALTATLCLAPQVGVNLVTYGTVFSELPKHAPDWLHPQFGRDLIAYPSGLFMLYPLSAISLVGAAGLAWQHRRALFTHALAAGFAGLLYVNACGGSGSSRRFACGVVVWVLGLGAILQWARSRSWSTLLVGGLAVAACARTLAMILLADRGLLNRYIFTAAPQDPPDILSGIARLASQYWAG